MLVKPLLVKASRVQKAKILDDATPNLKNYNSFHSQLLAKTSADISDFFKAGNQEFKKK